MSNSLCITDMKTVYILERNLSNCKCSQIIAEILKQQHLELHTLTFQNKQGV